MPAFRSVSEVDLGQVATYNAPPAGGWGGTATGLLQTGVSLLNMQEQAKIAKANAKIAAANARAAASAAAAGASRAGVGFELPFGLSPLTAVLGLLVAGGIAWAVSKRV